MAQASATGPATTNAPAMIKLILPNFFANPNIHDANYLPGSAILQLINEARKCRMSLEPNSQFRHISELIDKNNIAIEAFCGLDEHGARKTRVLQYNKKELDKIKPCIEGESEYPSIYMANLVTYYYSMIIMGTLLNDSETPDPQLVKLKDALETNLEEFMSKMFDSA